MLTGTYWPVSSCAKVAAVDVTGSKIVLSRVNRGSSVLRVPPGPAMAHWIVILLAFATILNIELKTLMPLSKVAMSSPNDWLR